MSSMIEVNSYSLAEASENRITEAPERRRETNMLALAWRSRWLLLLMMIIGAGGAWALAERVTPHYTSVSRIYVQPNLRHVLDDRQQAAQSASFLFTQAELIGSTSVLAAAAEAPDNATLETLRDVDNRVAFLKNCMEVSVGANDDIINVWSELPNAKDAAQLVNSVVDAYITKYAEERKTTAAEALGILRGEKTSRDEYLEECREAVDDFRRIHPELGVQVADGNIITHYFAQLTEELNATELELLDAISKYNGVKKMFESPTQRTFLLETASTERQAVRDIELERQVALVEQSLITERSRWGEGHPKVRLLKENLEELKEKLRKKQEAIVEAYVESLRQKVELLQHRKAQLFEAKEKQFQAATKVERLVIELKSLEAALERAEDDCDLINERIKEVNLTEDTGRMEVNILEPALVASDPSYPKPSRFLAGGIFLGGLVGFGLAWLRDLMDHRLRSVDEVTEVLQLPVMGVLPQFGGVRGAPHVGRIVAHAPRSPVAEAVRTLRTAIHFGLEGREAKTIAITSPSPGDGKSTVASNLAIAMAQADQRVLLIDADMRKPTQHTIFEVGMERGLSSVLSERRPIAEAIVPSCVESLDLLPCGPLPSNPVELLNNGFFADLLDMLKERYDKIIIDSPPVMPVADARVIAAISDSTLLVLRAERSGRRLSVGARNELWRVRAKRLGVTVNGVPSRKQGSYGYGDGDYGYGYGYGYGGYGAADDEHLSVARRKKSRSLAAPQPTQAAAGDDV
jgi:capsular exopolysaccharide synthesis family protein